MVAVVLALLVVGCGGKNVASSLPNGGIVYNKYNVHSFMDRKSIKASYANWVDVRTGQTVFPPNTKFQVGKWRGGFVLTKVDGGEAIHYEYNAKNMGMSVDDYIKLITSPTPVKLSGLSKLDQQGVREGKALKGMSKEGVKTALGYPAVHKTPSLSDNTWMYWRDRYRTLVVNFDASGKVVSVR
jgi:hypothetical protein